MFSFHIAWRWAHIVGSILKEPLKLLKSFDIASIHKIFQYENLQEKVSRGSQQSHQSNVTYQSVTIKLSIIHTLNSQYTLSTIGTCSDYLPSNIFINKSDNIKSPKAISEIVVWLWHTLEIQILELILWYAEYLILVWWHYNALSILHEFYINCNIAVSTFHPPT